jgi:alpha-glucosidase
VWDDTRVLDASVGAYILTARRTGARWFIGAMTNWTARDLDVDLSFLPSGTFRAEILRDGPNADRVGVDVTTETRTVSTRDRLHIHLAPGGGWVARLAPAAGSPPR